LLQQQDPIVSKAKTFIFSTLEKISIKTFLIEAFKFFQTWLFKFFLPHENKNLNDDEYYFNRNLSIPILVKIKGKFLVISNPKLSEKKIFNGWM